MLKETTNPIREHNRPAAAMWSAGGAAYDNVSFAISDALAHAAQRLAAVPGEKVLDVATGTGWSARNAARHGADVTGVDIAEDLLSAADAASGRFAGRIEFRLADAEALPFADASFDKVISTFGVMFAGDHERAAREIARVCRKGGRLVLATWPPDGAVAEFFGLIASHGDTPPPPASPLLWGDPGHVATLLGDDFDLTFETGTNNAYHESAEAIWDWYMDGFGPLCALHDSLDEKGREALRKDVNAYHDHYKVPAGLHVKRNYLLTIGTKR